MEESKTGMPQRRKCISEFIFLYSKNCCICRHDDFRGKNWNTYSVCCTQFRKLYFQPISFIFSLYIHTYISAFYHPSIKPFFSLTLYSGVSIWVPLCKNKNGTHKPHLCHCSRVHSCSIQQALYEELQQFLL